MTTTIEITVRRRIELNDDQLRYIEFFLEQGLYRVDVAATAKAFMAERDLEPIVDPVDTYVDGYVVGQMIFTPQPTCSVCGGTDFRYDESTGCGRAVDIEASDLSEQGGVLVVGGGNYYEGDDYPGVVCARCEAAIDLPANVDIDWS